MRCPKCDEYLKISVKFDYEDAIDYIFDGLINDGYAPHQDEIEILLHHTLDYLVKEGILESGKFKEHGNDI